MSRDGVSHFKCDVQAYSCYILANVTDNDMLCHILQTKVVVVIVILNVHSDNLKNVNFLKLFTCTYCFRNWECFIVTCNIEDYSPYWTSVYF